MSLDLVHVLGYERKRGSRQDVVGVLVAELHVLNVEGGPHLHGEASHNVRYKGLGEGDVVEVLCLMELLDNFQVSLQSFNLRRKSSATS